MDVSPDSEGDGQGHLLKDVLVVHLSSQSITPRRHWATNSPVYAHTREAPMPDLADAFAVALKKTGLTISGNHTA